MEVYNNTESVLVLTENYNSVKLAPKESGSLPFGSDSFGIQLDSRKIFYSRNIPNGGENGSYFNGSIRLQVNANGDIYILKNHELFPIADFNDQPEGYPLKGRL